MNTKGQSLIELIMVLPIFIAFWAAIAWFAHVMIISIELMHTARHGAFWLAYQSSDMKPAQETEQVKRECLEFLTKQAPRLDRRRISLKIKPGDRWRPVGPKTLLDIDGWTKLADRLKNVVKQASGLVHFQPADVTVSYRLDAPRVLRFIPGFPTQIPLEGRCVVYR
jgi:hypothetical protein